jgi:hypothetical protein
VIRKSDSPPKNPPHVRCFCKREEVVLTVSINQSSNPRNFAPEVSRHTAPGRFLDEKRMAKFSCESNCFLLSFVYHLPARHRTRLQTPPGRRTSSRLRRPVSPRNACRPSYGRATSSSTVGGMMSQSRTERIHWNPVGIDSRLISGPVSLTRTSQPSTGSKQSVRTFRRECERANHSRRCRNSY